MLEVVAFPVDKGNVFLGDVVLGLLLASEPFLQIHLPLEAGLPLAQHLEPQGCKAAEHGVEKADIRVTRRRARHNT